MGYNRDAVARAQEFYEARRVESDRVNKQRRGEVYRICPEIESIDRLLTQTHIKIAGVILNHERNIGDIRDENLTLQKRRAELLSANGFPADYFTVRYDCEKCCDVGYLPDDSICECLKRKIADETLKASGLAKLAKSQSFDCFKLDYYNDYTDVRGKVQTGVRQNMEENLRICREFADSFKAGEDVPTGNLFMIGQTGLGKSHLSTAIACEVIAKGFDVRYDFAQKIIYAFEKERFSRTLASEKNITEEYLTCDLLIIDDLGTEHPGAMSVSSLFNLVNTRLVNEKPTIINTNLVIKELQDKYVDRVVSRLFGEFTVLQFYGEDVRMKNI
ncbi:DNA replication protein DnaC [Clostridia bacterium]|nr:DNA replication protein DnaC [Clostridia bacterium]